MGFDTREGFEAYWKAGELMLGNFLLLTADNFRLKCNSIYLCMECPACCYHLFPRVSLKLLVSLNDNGKEGSWRNSFVLIFSNLWLTICIFKWLFLSDCLERTKNAKKIKNFFWLRMGDIMLRLKNQDSGLDHFQELLRYSNC